MTTIVPIPVETTMRRSLAGALAADPVFDERRRLVRRPRRTRGGGGSARVAPAAPVAEG